MRGKAMANDHLTEGIGSRICGTDKSVPYDTNWL